MKRSIVGLVILVALFTLAGCAQNPGVRVANPQVVERHIVDGNGQAVWEFTGSIQLDYGDTLRIVNDSHFNADVIGKITGEGFLFTTINRTLTLPPGGIYERQCQWESHGNLFVGDTHVYFDCGAVLLD